jgi:hypothetical protein
MKVIAVLLLLASISLTAAFVKHPVGSRANTDLSAMKKKMEGGRASSDKVCILTAHELDNFGNGEYVVSPRIVL